MHFKEWCWEGIRHRQEEVSKNSEWSACRLLQLLMLSSFCSWSHRQPQRSMCTQHDCPNCPLQGTARMGGWLVGCLLGWGPGLFSCPNPPFMCSLHLSHLCSPGGLGGIGNWRKPVDFWILPFLWVIESFISEKKKSDEMFHQPRNHLGLKFQSSLTSLAIVPDIQPVFKARCLHLWIFSVSVPSSSFLPP